MLDVMSKYVKNVTIAPGLPYMPYGLWSSSVKVIFSWLVCEDFVLGGAYNFSTRRNEYCILGMHITRN